MIQTLIDEQTISNKISELANQISIDYANKDLTVIIVLNGAIIFASDLIRKISIPLQVDSFAASSYINDKSSGVLNIRSQLKLPIENRHILIIDDILDTGNSLKSLISYFNKLHPVSIKTCVLLNKNIQDKLIEKADYTGFYIPNKYVVGYGLDSNEYYRNLPYIGIMVN